MTKTKKVLKPTKEQQRILSDGILQWWFPEWWFSKKDGAK